MNMHKATHPQPLIPTHPPTRQNNTDQHKQQTSPYTLKPPTTHHTYPQLTHHTHPDPTTQPTSQHTHNTPDQHTLSTPTNPKRQKEVVINRRNPMCESVVRLVVSGSCQDVPHAES
ncbi:hypothetical protein GCM10028832_03800 [Streptomyces sparsus]